MKSDNFLAWELPGLMQDGAVGFGPRVQQGKDVEVGGGHLVCS